MSTLKKVIWPQIILFGDSITQVTIWGHRALWVLKCDVVNRGLSGYNTRWAKIVLPRIVPISDAPIAAVTVFFGANDCAVEDKNPAQHVPLQEFTDNLKDIVKYLLSIGVSNDKIIFITPPPLQEAAWEKECLLKGDTSSPEFRLCSILVYCMLHSVVLENSITFHVSFQDLNISGSDTSLSMRHLQTFLSRQEPRAARASPGVHGQFKRYCQISAVYRSVQ
uniref:1-alkyl-2-acetylglycerophosphocholine esterase n=1 Tax=Sinocyclocheilus rhinocerous TaxID=307959 RepID=A0A673L453_9TELE